MVECVAVVRLPRSAVRLVVRRRFDLVDCEVIRRISPEGRRQCSATRAWLDKNHASRQRWLLVRISTRPVIADQRHRLAPSARWDGLLNHLTF